MHHTHSSSKTSQLRLTDSKSHDHCKQNLHLNARQSTSQSKALAIATALILATLLSLDPVNANSPNDTMATDNVFTTPNYLWEEDICEH